MVANEMCRVADISVTSGFVVLASADVTLRHKLNEGLRGLRWRVRETRSGAEAMEQLEMELPEALIIDGWLPDLDIDEVVTQIGLLYPKIDILRISGEGVSLAKGTSQEVRSPRRNELLHAIRLAQSVRLSGALPENPRDQGLMSRPNSNFRKEALPSTLPVPLANVMDQFPEMVGNSQPMRDLISMIRLVAPRKTSVLIEGETGTGKEIVARAVHRLSSRADKPFIIINCAAIPETLLEAELFGHTKGAFTGAIQARVGRMEAAHGGTLFLDEIGEIPLSLQAKMLRFLECGELQRVGDNQTSRVDVRVIAATHQPLARRAAEGTFRLDLYHRLAVFPLEVPALRTRAGDLPLLIQFFLDQLSKEMARKTISEKAIVALCSHLWPGNVRELMHVLERGAILAGDRLEIGCNDIRIMS